MVIPFNKILVYADNNTVFDFKAAASRATLLEKRERYSCVPFDGAGCSKSG